MERHIQRLARNLAVCTIACGVLSACGGHSGPLSPTAIPSAPIQTPPPIPQGPFTVSGVVSEMVGNLIVPLEGAHVEDSMRHYYVKTGGDGSYTIRDVAAGAAYFYVAKDGFRSQTRQFSLTADTRLDLQLVRQ